MTSAAPIKLIITTFFVVTWISLSFSKNMVIQSSKNIIRTRKQMTSLHRSDPELKSRYVRNLISTNSSSPSDNFLYSLIKALMDKNQEFRSLNNSKLKSADATLNVTNTAHDDKIDSVVNLSIIITGRQDLFPDIPPGHSDFYEWPVIDEEEKSETVRDVGVGTTIPPHLHTPSDFAIKTLERHNVYRKLHGVPSLVYSAKLSKLSEDWAKHLAKNNLFEHRPKNKFGENLYMIRNTNPKFKLTPYDAVDAWYNEIHDYDWDEEPVPEDMHKIGHFTQLVWKNSAEMGFGLAQSEDTGAYFVACNYNPPGNIIGGFKRNVLKAQEGHPVEGKKKKKETEHRHLTFGIRQKNIRNVYRGLI